MPKAMLINRFKNINKIANKLNKIGNLQKL